MEEGIKIDLTYVDVPSEIFWGDGPIKCRHERISDCPYCREVEGK